MSKSPKLTNIVIMVQNGICVDFPLGVTQICYKVKTENTILCKSNVNRNYALYLSPHHNKSLKIVSYIICGKLEHCFDCDSNPH